MRANRQMGVSVIALTGHLETPLGQFADVEFATSVGSFADRIQELHINVIHILVELLEGEMFPGLNS